MYLHTAFSWCKEKLSQYLLELIKGRSKVHQKNSSLERTLDYDHLQTLFVEKITENNCRFLLCEELKDIKDILKRYTVLLFTT